MFSEQLLELYNDEFFIIVSTYTNEITIEAFSEKSLCLYFKEKFGKDETRIKISWWYTSDDGYQDSRDLDITFDEETYDQFYPGIKEGLKKYLDSYRKNKSSVLLLMGEPGTGKTTFIKNFIKEYQLNTVVTYDEKVMSSDFFYIQYLTDSKKQLLVIEDADLLLSSRDDNLNKTMSKLLNITDGLVKLDSKKIIFTTNTQQYTKIDNALIRPGRCFDVINFRRLTFDEAKTACKVAKLPPITEEREHTLTEIFNRNHHSYKSFKIGF
jgi:SpoVK/Ycf46/Vps4 family AAA+-type ATPase